MLTYSSPNATARSSPLKRSDNAAAHIVLPESVLRPSHMIFSNVKETTEGEKNTHVFNTTHAIGEHNIKGLRPILSERRPIVGLNRNSNKPIVDAHLPKIVDILVASFLSNFPSCVECALKSVTRLRLSVILLQKRSICENI
jgi:hypothetical protein